MQNTPLRVHIVEQSSGMGYIEPDALGFEKIENIEVFTPELSASELKEYHQYFKESDAFIILPNANPLVVASILVDRQYSDIAAVKPVIIYHEEDKPSPWVGLVNDLKAAGFIKQDFKRLISNVTDDLADVSFFLSSHMKVYREKLKSAKENRTIFNSDYPIDKALDFAKQHNKHINWERMSELKENICVFCSNSTEDERFLDQSLKTGEIIAKNNKALVFGGSNRSMMDGVAKSAQSNGTYVIGITTPTFVGKELILDGSNIHIDPIEIAEDIYARMHDMFAHSKSLVVLAGGLGTVQETIASFKMKQDYPEMKDKKIIIVNEYSFWNDFIKILISAGYEIGEDFEVVNNLDELDNII